MAGEEMIPMKLKLMGGMVMSLSLLAMQGSAQTAAELLQKAIFTEQSTGDVDGAVKIFRQIVASNPQRVIAAQAQYLLVQALMRKNDLGEAAKELGKLAHDYPDYKDLVKTLVPALAQAAQAGTACAILGTVQNGRYHHAKTGVEFDVPADWSVTCTSPSSGNGEMAVLSNTTFPNGDAFVWMTSENIPAADVHSRLQWDLAEKEGVRRSQYSEQYGYRAGSVQDITVGGQQGLAALADYPRGETKMTEIHTWIYTTKTRVYVSGKVATSDLAAFQPRLEAIIRSMLVP
jgi:tetratricopeptide (TPR) repeat protein